MPSVSQGDGDETIMKHPITVHEVTECFSYDLCETPLKPPNRPTDSVSGDSDLSLGPDLRTIGTVFFTGSVRTDACPDSRKPSQDSDLKKKVES